MAAKRKRRASRKRASTKKKVTISVDAETLRKLADAVAALSEFGGGTIKLVDDAGLRRELVKRSKRRGKKRR